MIGVTKSPGMESRSWARKSVMSYVGGRPNFFSMPELQRQADASRTRQLRGETLLTPRNEITSEFFNRRSTASTNISRVMSSYGDSQRYANVPLESTALRFFCYQIEAVEYSKDERERVRYFVFSVYPKDNTMQLHEPHTPNSGMPQGTIVKRTHIPKKDTDEYLTLEDIKLGVSLDIYGRTIHIASCDNFTRDFFRRRGMDLGVEQEMPQDMHAQKRLLMDPPPVPPPSHEEQQLAIQKFLRFDGQVLRFSAVWVDENLAWGVDARRFTIEYYLADDSIQILELFAVNAGRDQNPVFLRRQKLPKSTPPASQLFNAVPIEYVKVEDLAVGKQLSVFGRMFLLCDADDFTRQFYKINFNTGDWPKQDAAKVAAKSLEVSLPEKWRSSLPPPPKVYGSEEDSLESFRHVVLRAPKSNRNNFLLLGDKQLRFRARLLEDNDLTLPARNFSLSFWLVDNTIAIYEVHKGRSDLFLRRTSVIAPSGNPYTIEDMHAGSIITVFSRKFLLTEADAFTQNLLLELAKEGTTNDAATAPKVAPEAPEEKTPRRSKYLHNVNGTEKEAVPIKSILVNANYTAPEKNDNSNNNNNSSNDNNNKIEVSSNGNSPFKNITQSRPKSGRRSGAAVSSDSKGNAEIKFDSVPQTANSIIFENHSSSGSRRVPHLDFKVSSEQVGWADSMMQHDDIGSFVPSQYSPHKSPPRSALKSRRGGTGAGSSSSARKSQYE